MNAKGHASKAERIQASLAKLSDSEDHELVIEACYAAALHYLAVISETRVKGHQDTHKSLPAFLDEHGLTDLATAFRDLDILRAGQYYGAQGNGHAAREARRLLAEIKSRVH